MKKIILLLIFISSINIYSQAPRGLYVIAGASQTTLKTKDLISQPGLGFNVGIAFAMGYHETYNFQFELLASQKSLSLKTIDNSFENVSDSKITTNNFDFAFYTNYYILTPDEDKLFIGPQIGISSEFGHQFSPKDNDSQVLIPHLVNTSELQNTSNFNLGTVIGLTGGYNRFKFDIRYSIGQSNMLKHIQTDSRNQYNEYTGPMLNGKLNTISFNLSYLIYKRIKKR